MILKSKVTGGRLTIEGEFSMPIENLTEKVNDSLNLALNQLGASMHGTWSAVARKKLKHSESYTDSLAQSRSSQKGNLSYKITQTQRTSDGKHNVGMLLEEGIDAFDMKEKILKGAKFKKVRFIYGSPEQKHSKQLPEDIYKLVKKNKDQSKFTQSDYIQAFGDTKADTLSPKKEKYFTMLGRNLNNFPSENFRREDNKVPDVVRIRSNPNMFAKTIKYQWQAPEFHNLKKDMFKSGGEVANHTFSTFRTISKNSPQDSWIHPGIIPKRILAESMEEHTPTIRPILTTALQRALGDIK